jgi:hypothetical protein
MNFISNSITQLTQADFDNTAKKLNIESAAIQAVCTVESSGSGFLPDKRPRILFESHTFHSLTKGIYDNKYPNISTANWVHNYGADGSHQYDRLNIALQLNQNDALESASWGKFQIMGMNYASCRFNDVLSFVTAMVTSEVEHLNAFEAFCVHNNLIRFLAAHNWTAFALHYNGPGQVDFYASKVQQAYNTHKKP